METVAMTCREYSQIARTVFQYTWTGPAIDDERKVLNPKLHLLDVLEEYGPMSIGELLGNVSATVEYHTDDDGDDVVDFAYDLEHHDKVRRCVVRGVRGWVET